MYELMLKYINISRFEQDLRNCPPHLKETNPNIKAYYSEENDFGRRTSLEIDRKLMALLSTLGELIQPRYKLPGGWPSIFLQDVLYQIHDELRGINEQSGFFNVCFSKFQVSHDQ